MGEIGGPERVLFSIVLSLRRRAHFHAGASFMCSKVSFL